MSGIASIRFYTKRINSMDQDRQSERARLWEVRREFEVQERHMLATLQDLYRRLGDCEIEIERLRQALESGKQSTIALVQWKAMNLKREDRIVADLKKVEAAGRVDVGNLIKRLEEAHETLDALTAETDVIDELVDRDVRGPARAAGKVRKQIQQSVILKAEVFHSPPPRPHTAAPGEADALLIEYRDENTQLASKNDSLRQQIASLEDAISQFPKKTIAIMEDMIPPPKLVLKRPPPSLKKPPEKQITRPRTTMAAISTRPFETPRRD
jgi:cell division septum initiation protein DivIVA